MLHMRMSCMLSGKLIDGFRNTVSQTLLMVSVELEVCEDYVSQGAADSGFKIVGAGGGGSPELSYLSRLSSC